MGSKLGINPWFKIWIHPKRTVRRIVDTDPNYRLLCLSTIYGFPFLLQLAQSLSLSFFITWPLILLASLILAPFIGYLGISVMSGLYSWVGKWLGGRGDFKDVRTAVAWSYLPVSFTALSWLLLAFIFRANVFYGDFFPQMLMAKEGIWIMVFGAVQFLVWIWSLSILMGGLAEVHEFSIGKAILNVILTFVLVAVALWALMWAIWWYRGLM